MQLIRVNNYIIVNFSFKNKALRIEIQIGVVAVNTFPSLNGRFIIT